MYKLKTAMMLALITCIVLISLTYMRRYAHATTSFSLTVAGTNDDERDDSSNQVPGGSAEPGNVEGSNWSPWVNHVLGRPAKAPVPYTEPASNFAPLMAIFSGVIALGMVYKFGPNVYAKCKNRKQTNA